MTPLILVLLAAQSAWAASSVLVRQYDINQIPRPVETSAGLVTPYLIESTWELLDEGDVNLHILNIEQTLKDLARSSDARAQALALCQTLAVVGELAAGRAGDACDYTDFINAVILNNVSPVAVGRWLSRVNYDIDSIVALAENRVSIRDQTGPRAYCVGGGRAFDLEAAWDPLITDINAVEPDLLNEQLCIVKRLARSWSSTSNLVAAAVSSCANSRVNEIFRKALPDVANLLRTVANNGNVALAAAQAKVALSAAAY